MRLGNFIVAVSIIIFLVLAMYTIDCWKDYKELLVTMDEVITEELRK